MRGRSLETKQYLLIQELLYLPICCLLFLSVPFRTQRKHTFNVKTQLHVYIRAYQHTTRVSSKTCACVQGLYISNHDYSQPSWWVSAQYACAQPNVGVSSAVVRSGVSRVQWQLEQKERYHAKCSKAWARN